MDAPLSVDAYIAAADPAAQERLRAIRSLVRGLAPEAREKISYGMPTFELHGNLVHYAAFKAHIGFYPTPSGTEAFQAQLAPYVHGKGSIRFPLDQPLPLALIEEIVRYRLAENQAGAAARGKKRKPGAEPA